MGDLELVTFSELIDKLNVVNIKLFNLLEKTAELDRKVKKTADDVALIVQLSGDNIRLAKQRSSLKSAIDKKLNVAIQKGGTEILDEVKNY
jgi:hypothetical protein